MNTEQRYQRGSDRRLNEAPSTVESAQASDVLATHQDPSLPDTRSQPASERSRPTVAWVRPSELASAVGAPWVRRGIDLQAELTRRARRTPGTVARKASHRISRTAIAKPEPDTTTRSIEGLRL